jgi:uncharacterized protein (DUF2147 family)
MKYQKILFLAALFSFFSVAAWAEALSPVGKWKTIDDNTKEEKSIVEITQDGDHLVGKIIEIFPKPGKDPNPKCTKCDGDKKDQPMLGMTILWDMKKDGDLRWSGGHILDPEKGETYRCRLKLSSDGKTLNVRGYLGVSLFGRSQDWPRQD